MAKDKVYGFISGIPPWGKAIVAIGTLGLMSAVGITVYKRINEASRKRDAEKKSDNLNSNTQSAVDALATKGIYPTATQAQYDSWASSLESCFQGWGTCSSYTEVFSSLNNEADLNKLIQAFGIRTISSGKWNMSPDFTGDLSGVVVDELSSGEVSAVNTILANKGIKFRF